MSRFARNRRVFFVEEPVWGAAEPVLEVRTCPVTEVVIVTPHLGSETARNEVLSALLAEFALNHAIHRPLVWFYTPMALAFFPRSITPSAVVYDCMDELSMFRGAPAELQAREKELLGLCDLVFTGGVSLFEAKKNAHANVHAFPSGVDIEHFKQARGRTGEFAEQQQLPRPRLGYAGVIDERIDLSLLEAMARQRPLWQIVMIGPIAKISPDDLPKCANIHWLGMKGYADLPHYFAGWDVGIMPFAMNDSTRFISPTKTPEYLAAGLPVVSTPIRDVVRPYQELGLVRIAESAEEFIRAAEQAMAVDRNDERQARADEFLKRVPWDCVWDGMNELITSVRTPVTETPVRRTPVTRQISELARV